MSAAAPARARRAIEGLALAPHTSETAVLLTSELVSNAVRHSGAVDSDTIRLLACVCDSTVRISVTDPGLGFSPTGERAAPGVRGGFGLMLVERLADSWGVESGAGTTVWIKLTLEH